MSSESEPSEENTGDEKEKGIKRATISKIEIKPINYSGSSNAHQGNNTKSKEIVSNDSLEPYKFKKFVDYGTSNPSYQPGVKKFDHFRTSYPPESPIKQKRIIGDDRFSPADVFNFNDATTRDYRYSYQPKIKDQLKTLKSSSPAKKTDFERMPSTSTSFRTRLDIGTGFNMRIMSNGTDNLNQLTTLRSDAPSLKTPRIADAPFNITQRTILTIKPKLKKSPQKATKTSPTTPQLSYGTYGWARIPRNEAQMSSRFKQSPTKEHSKKKTTPTPIRRLRNIQTYRESPPPITVARERRPHGIFSPKSVYKRQFLSRRNLFGDGNDSPESSWGSGTWHDIHEHGFSGQMSPVERSDHSLPWETSDQTEQTIFHPPSVQSPQSRQMKNSARSRRVRKESPMSPISTSSPYSSSMETSPEELDWSGLFSPDSPEIHSQGSLEPSGSRYVIQSEGTKRYFQPSKGFIPSTL
ncbi:uncharacterized protein [Parasteatoda tepidariorum]|uniref:uncharacterized protein n=1 Tax=Parasteatoda tepidariorum TaxID=114398 RepID=UPI0039BC3C51